ncbi:tyrosinase family oxidase copper chaperone [Streptomyces sp. NPDC097619]|uniref:tyrosinase family oxidase copper chaperone n=1 Tax=Streptomyces sp. NPDC097619 TaxID=3157228 RepID=UPI00332B6451
MSQQPVTWRSGGPRTLTRPLAGGPLPGRRAVLRAAFTVAVVSATAAALAPVLRATTRSTVAPARTPGPEPVPAPAPGPAPAPVFEETYRGRHIAAYRGTARTASGRETVDVRIDGRPLHVMRRADGSWLSGVNHFESFASPRDLARAAVDELGALQLATGPSGHHG